MHNTRSFVLYDISHPNKYGVPQVDFSADSEAAISDAMKLTPCQLALERLIVKIFNKYRCDVIITDRVRTLFSSKLWRMGKALQGLGGTGRSKLLHRWRWIVKLQIEESSSRKRKPDHISTVSSNAAKIKCSKLESELNECKKELKEKTNQLNSLEKSNKTLCEFCSLSKKEETLEYMLQTIST